MTKTVTLKLNIAPRDGVTKVARRTPVPSADPATPAAAAMPAPTATEPGRVARLLAIAYRIEELIEVGALCDYRDAARRLGISAPHLTHYMALLDLAAPIQEDILLGRLDVPERSLRGIAVVAAWLDQKPRG